MIKIENDAMCGIKGMIDLQVINDDGSVTEEVKDCKNLILDSWMSIMDSTSNQHWGLSSADTMVIGTGATTPPAPEDTSLNNQIKVVAPSTSRPYDYLTTEHHVARIIYTGEFTGFTEDTYVTEIGMKKTNTILMSRALIKDNEGNAMSIKVGLGQTLRIVYSFYFLTPVIMKEETIITDLGSTTYIIGAFSEAQEFLNILSNGLANTYQNASQWGEIAASMYIDGAGKGINVSTSFSGGGCNRKIKLNTPDISTSSRRIGKTTDSSLPKYNGKIPMTVLTSNRRTLGVIMLLDSIDDRPTLPANTNIEIDIRITWGRII